MTDPGTRPYLFMLCGSFSFTLMAELAHVLTRVCDWQAVAVVRSLLAAAFAALLARLAGASFVFLRPARLWVRSVAGSLSMVCTFYAFGKLPAADVLTLTNTFPLWVAVLSWPLHGRPPGGRVWVAVAAGIAGVGLVEQPHLEAGNWGAVSALAAAGFTAVAMLGLHSLRGIDPRAVVVHFSAVAVAVCGLAFALGGPVADPARLTDGDILLKMLGLGVSATVGQLFLTRAFGEGAPAKVSVVGLSQVVFALVFDVALWGREVNAVTLAGTVLVIAPTAWLLTHPEEGRP